MRNKNMLMVGLIVWLLGSLFFLTEYFVRVSTGVLSDTLFHEFNASAASVGLLSAYFYYAYIGMQIPVGVLVDRFGAKYLLSSATIIFGIACFIFAQMHVLQTGYLARFIMGFVGAFAFVGTLKLITVYFKPEQFAMLSGITQGLGMVGAVIGAAPMAYLFSVIGWRSSFIYFAIVFIVLGVAMLILIREDRSEIKSEPTIHSSLLGDIKLVLSNRQTWINCLFIGLMYAPTEVFGEQWGTLFGQYNNNLTVSQAAFQVSCIFIGMALGCPLIGTISDKIRSRVKVMRWCSLVCAILITMVIYEHAFDFDYGYYMVCIIMFIYGIFGSAIIPSYAIATEINTKKVAGIALGITNMATVIIGALFIPLIGHILDLLASIHSSPDDLQVVYSINDFQYGFAMLPLCFIICFILTFFIKDTLSNKKTDVL